MLRVGDKVYKWTEMNRVGVVERLVEYHTNQWVAGGAPTGRLFASVRYDKNTVVDIPVSELKLLERP
jgi:hypothetical protein